MRATTDILEATKHGKLILMVIPTPFVASVMAQVCGAISEDQVRLSHQFMVQMSMNLVTDSLKICFEYRCFDKTHLNESHVVTADCMQLYKRHPE